MAKLKIVYLRAGVDVPPEIVEIENFEDIKQLLEANNIATANRFFGKDRFSIFCNFNAEEEGKAVSSLFSFNNKPLLFDLFGNLVVCGYPSFEDENNLIGLSDEEIKTVLRHVISVDNSSFAFLF